MKKYKIIIHKILIYLLPIFLICACLGLFMFEDTLLFYIFLGLFFISLWGVYYFKGLLIMVLSPVIAGLVFSYFDNAKLAIPIMLSLSIIGIVVIVLEKHYLRKKIENLFIKTYKETPLEIIYRRYMDIKKNKEFCGTLFLFGLFKVSIETEVGWKDLYYDRVSKNLIEKEKLSI